MKQTCSEETIVDACFAQIDPAHNHRDSAASFGLRQLRWKWLGCGLQHANLQPVAGLSHHHLQLHDRSQRAGRWQRADGDADHHRRMRHRVLRGLPAWL
jgi:hypothetical protein